MSRLLPLLLLVIATGTASAAVDADAEAERDAEAAREELENELGDIEGLEMRILGGVLVVEGDVMLELDLARVKKAIAGKPEVVNRVRLAPIVCRFISSDIQKEIARAFRGNVPDDIVLVQRAADAAAESEAKRRADLLRALPSLRGTAAVEILLAASANREQQMARRFLAFYRVRRFDFPDEPYDVRAALEYEREIFDAEQEIRVLGIRECEALGDAVRERCDEFRTVWDEEFLRAIPSSS